MVYFILLECSIPLCLVLNMQVSSCYKLTLVDFRFYLPIVMGISSLVFVCMCVCVCLGRISSETAEPIWLKFCKATEIYPGQRVSDFGGDVHNGLQIPDPKLEEGRNSSLSESDLNAIISKTINRSGCPMAPPPPSARPNILRFGGYFSSTFNFKALFHIRSLNLNGSAIALIFRTDTCTVKVKR